MKYLVTGGTGQLGREVVRLLQHEFPYCQVVAPGRGSLDLLMPDAVKNYLDRVAPDVIVNCGAWTAVDDAERDPKSVRLANAESPTAMATYCSATGAYLLQVSTDYVFSGSSTLGYREWDPVDPESVYGQTKAEAEAAIAHTLPERHAIVRTAWLYGESHNNFACKVARRLHSGEPVRVVDDQKGSPSWSRDVAYRIVDLLMWWRSNLGPIGTVHAVNTGSATWFEFAQVMADLEGFDPSQVTPISSSSLDQIATRPAHSELLDTRCSGDFGLAPMRPWDEALHSALPKLVPLWLES